MNKWKLYTIMHMDREVASIRSDGTCEIYSADFMPYNIYLEEIEENDIDEQINNLSNFYYWCSSRILTLDRKYAKEILNSLGKKQAVTDKDRAAIAISYHCVSLTDVYWVRGYNEDIKFSDVNLFEHSLSDLFVDVALRGRQMTVQNAELIQPKDVAGDIATSGVAPKAWIRRNGAFFMMKDGDSRDVDAELLASKIIDCFDVPHVSYMEDYYDGTKVSVCEIITSLRYSIVPMEYVDIYAVNHEKNKFDYIFPEYAYEYYMMNIVDYLIGNTDRHWGNWGMQIDNLTNRWIGIHPLMDYNKAFSSYDDLEGAMCQTTKEKMSQREAAVFAVKQVGLNQIHEVDETWFSDKRLFEQFQKRLHFLQESGADRL